MTRATFVIFWPKLSSFIDWCCYYTHVSYTGSCEPLVIILAHWNNSPKVDMLRHSDTLSGFRANQSLLFLLNAACLAEKQSYYKFNSQWFDPTRAQIRNLPHSRRACLPLRHRCSSCTLIIGSNYKWFSDNSFCVH